MNDSAVQLDQIGKELRKLVGRFKLSTEDAIRRMNTEPLRVLIVDDSRIFRAALQDALEGRPGIRVVGSVWSGEKALEFVRHSPPDLVTLDVNMPGQGGLETLSDIQDLNASRPGQPPVGVLLVSALTSRERPPPSKGSSGVRSTSSASPTGPMKRPMRPCCSNS